MATFSPIADGFFQVAYDGASYTRSVTANPIVQERTGNNDIIAGVSFDISALAGLVPTAVSLAFGIAQLTVVTAPNGIELRTVSPGTATLVASLDGDWFTNAHNYSAPQLYSSQRDTPAGSFVVSLGANGLADLKTCIAEPQNEFPIAFTFDPASSTHEAIALAANPQLIVTLPEEPIVRSGWDWITPHKNKEWAR